MLIDKYETVFCPITKAKCTPLEHVRNGDFTYRCAFGECSEAEDGARDLQCDLAVIAHSIADDVRDYGAPCLDVIVRNIRELLVRI